MKKIKKATKNGLWLIQRIIWRRKKQEKRIRKIEIIEYEKVKPKLAESKKNWIWGMSQENLQQQIEQVIEKMKEIPERIEKLKRLVISG